MGIKQEWLLSFSNLKVYYLKFYTLFLLDIFSGNAECKNNCPMRWIWIRLKMFISVVFFGCVILISCWIILPKTEQCLVWSFRLDLKRKTNLLWARCFIHYQSSLKQSCKLDAVMFFVYMRKQRWRWHRFYKSLLHTEPEFTSRSAWFQNPWLFIPLSQTVQTQWKQNDILEYLGKNFIQDYEKEHSTNSLLHNLHTVISVSTSLKLTRQK